MGTETFLNNEDDIKKHNLNKVRMRYFLTKFCFQ